MAPPSEPRASGLKRQAITELDGQTAPKAALVCAGHAPVQSSRRILFHSPPRPSLAESCVNYIKSKVPCRIMFYHRGDWRNFPKSAVQTLIDAFKDDRSSTRFSIGDEPLLFDFLSMAVVNLRTRQQRSVAWIDEADKCFFPTVFDQDNDDSKEWDFVVMDERLQIGELGSASVPQPEVVKHVVRENGGPSAQRQATIAELRTKIEALDRGSEGFRFVLNMFLAGMEPFAKPENIVAIHRYAPKDVKGQIQLETFERQIKVTTEERGDANVRYGWFGAEKLDIVQVLIHGFGLCGKPTNGGALGTGLYLTPAARSFSSVNLCDVDEKGKQYMILSRVILGNTEQVNPRSEQHYPSSGDYDSGVDDCSSPKCYVVWPTHLSSYLHPAFLVIFKLSPVIRDYLFRLQDVRFHVSKPPGGSDLSIHPQLRTSVGSFLTGKHSIATRVLLANKSIMCQQLNAPTSPWLSFTKLFQAIQDSVSPVALELLLLHHQELKSKIITREDFISKIRLIVGDRLLFSVMANFKRDPSSWPSGPVAGNTNLEASTVLTSEPNHNEAEKTEINGSTAPMD